MYKQVYPAMRRHGKCNFLKWVENINNSTQLLNNYYISQMAIILERNQIDGNKIIKSYIAIKWILPYISFRGECSNKLHISTEELMVYIENGLNIVSIDTLMREIQREYRIREVPNFSEFDMEDYLLAESNLLRKVGDKVYFPHQMYRDYLSAKYIIENTTNKNVDEIWNMRKFPYSVTRHIAEMTKNQWNKTAQIIADDAKGKKDEKYNQILNLVTVFNGSDADYSGLDLSNIRLSKQDLGNIKLRDAIISRYSIGCENSLLKQYRFLQFSEDNHWLIGLECSNLILWDVETGNNVGKWRLKGQLLAISFKKCFLFISIKMTNSNRIEIFEYNNKKWQMNGVIDLPNGNYKIIILDYDNLVHVYYNNRECRYRTIDCKLIYNVQKKHPYEFICDGYELPLIKKQLIKPIINEELSAYTISIDKQFEAFCYKDGRFNICYAGGEVLHKLYDKRTILKDATISDNGCHAVTLSYDSFNGCRKIQLWDLVQKIRIGERLCPKNTHSVHLVETGEWILGKEENKTLCWNWEDEDKFYYLTSEIISNQYKKISSYGNRILLRNACRMVELFDLDTMTTTEFKNIPKDVKLAVILPNAKLAVVDEKLQYVTFRSLRSGDELKVNSQPAKILGLYAFHKEPFIAVATNDNVISMYHNGTGQRTRILKSNAGCRIITGHAQKMAIASSGNGNRVIVFRYFSWDNGKKGNWYEKESMIEITGNVLDIAFNASNEELVVITTSGLIYYMSDLFCDYHSQTQVINGFNVMAYDFNGVICEDYVKEQLKENGCSFVD
jgi:hypothetical protein